MLIEGKERILSHADLGIKDKHDQVQGLKEEIKAEKKGTQEKQTRVHGIQALLRRTKHEHNSNLEQRDQVSLRLYVAMA